jgi:hypothetical protein
MSTEYEVAIEVREKGGVRRHLVSVEASDPDPDAAVEAARLDALATFQKQGRNDPVATFASCCRVLSVRPAARMAHPELDAVYDDLPPEYVDP